MIFFHKALRELSVGAAKHPAGFDVLTSLFFSLTQQAHLCFKRLKYFEKKKKKGLTNVTQSSLSMLQHSRWWENNSDFNNILFWKFSKFQKTLLMNSKKIYLNSMTDLKNCLGFINIIYHLLLNVFDSMF